MPDVRTFGTIALAGEHLGPWRDPKSAIAAITGICTLVSWAIIGWLVVTGKDS